MKEPLDKDLFESTKVRDLSNFQLYCLQLYKYLPQHVITNINNELINRNIDSHELSELAMQHKEVHGKLSINDISTTQKLLIVLVPFPIIIHALIAIKYLKRREQYKWKQYWKFVELGFLFWFLVIILVLIL